MPVALAVALFLGLGFACMGYPLPLLGTLVIYFLSLGIGIIISFNEIKGLFWPYFFTIFPAIHLGMANERSADVLLSLSNVNLI